jgi:hypothetical protein
LEMLPEEILQLSNLKSIHAMENPIVFISPKFKYCPALLSISCLKFPRPIPTISEFFEVHSDLYNEEV